MLDGLTFVTPLSSNSIKYLLFDAINLFLQIIFGYSIWSNIWYLFKHNVANWSMQTVIDDECEIDVTGEKGFWDII